ncbi:hypothetical protein PENDEC_c031G02206 [Penicillium decumbens]|uniref:Zn(2)-C6 fungal-type domain-containing protein n=1 Tax=Penicillium decumbens TaxID=69771 RepID=A0A1V6NVW5_PENDC|nr:hypothetical protein PENDEC_c031G02206 [Penicillium decumbens]
MPRSALACHACRKRKVKCDRQFPQCLVCDQTGQTCNYPLRSMKPGPKIGSSQKQRKYRRLKETASSRHASSYSSPPVGPGISPQGSDLDILDNGLEKGEVVPAVPTDPTETSARVETRKGERQRASQSNTLDLAFILHPSHEATTPGHTFKQSPHSQDRGHVGLCGQACKELHVSQAAMNKIIRVFFDNMVAINIFHEPSFAKKLSKISSLPQLTGLLAAIAAYASRFEALGADDLASNTVQLAAMRHQQPAYFIELAFKYINEALMECDDGTPPLCVIQALIIATHCRLTQGVRGKAWRSLGLCVSLIYETNLHLLDSKKVGKAEGLSRWQEEEEKRRAFWAVWEMDVFASTIRRTPTGIDWNQMEVLLPVDNSRFDVLYLTYKRCVQFWDVQTALQRNLEVIEEQLEARHKRPVTRAPSSQEASKRPPEDTRTTHQPLSDHGMERSAKKAQTPRQVAQYLPETPGLPPTSSLLIDDGLEMNPQYSAQQHPYAADSVAMLDFMTLPQPTRNQVSEVHMVPTSSDFLDSMYLGDFELDRALYWPTFDFPGGTHDLAAGWITG